MTVIIFLIVLAVLIFVHELGHFVFAKWNGIRVDEFKIGFGPRIFGKKFGETEYGLNLIPFGGYVKIHGENPNEENTTGNDSHRSFVNKKKWQQIIVLVAGVGFNFIFAWLIYVFAFTSGVNTTVSGHEKYTKYLSNERIMVTLVSPNSPAARAGLKEGDELISIDSGALNGKVLAQYAKPTIKQIQDSIDNSHGDPISVVYKRNKTDIGKPFSSTMITPIEGLVKDRYAIGIAMDNVVNMKLPFFISVWEGLKYTGNMIWMTAVGLYHFVVNIFTGNANFSDVTGPVGIAGIVGDAATLGFVYLLMITAIISINLGVINLVPFPALDGGRALFVIVEVIIRRRIPAKFFNIVNGIGFALLMILMIVVTYKDVMKMFGK